MEHRYDKRFPTDFKTLIFKNGMPVAIGRIRNFSQAGLFVKTEFDLVGINQALEIELIGRSSRCCSAPRLCKTLVMHKASGGIGLLLRDDCVETKNSYATFIADELSRNPQEFDSPSAAAGTRCANDAGLDN